MSKLQLLCRNATAFAADGSLDEDAYRQLLQRLVDSNIGVYLASAGSGESSAMTEAELRRVYRIGVDACKGKVAACGNPPEQPTVRESLHHINLAIESGVELVNIYGPAGWHSYRPTDDEFRAFFDELLPQVKHPVSLAPNTTIGYAPNPAMIAGLCHKYSQVAAVHLVSQTDDYFIELKDRLKRDIPLYAPFEGSLGMLLMGAAGVIGGEQNMLPKTFRCYIDHFESGKIVEAAQVYADLKRFMRYITTWRGAFPRPIKMMMKVFRIPGYTLRGPYQMPADDELAKFADGLLQLHLPEIDEMARAAGMTVPA
jgi:4-hydroxy-tetrahydrodipicolinate synthase